MDYAGGGGRLIVFGSDQTVDTLLSRAENSTSAAFQRLRSAPAQAGAGNLVRIRESWPTSYFQTTSVPQGVAGHPRIVSLGILGSHCIDPISAPGATPTATVIRRNPFPARACRNTRVLPSAAPRPTVDEKR
jgi:hypothetical protein